MVVPSIVLFLKKSRASVKVSIRTPVVKASVLWSKRYPSRSAYIFFNDTMAGNGGTSKVVATPVVLSLAINCLDDFAAGDWRLPEGSSLIFVESGCKLHERVGSLETVVPDHVQ